MDLAVAPPDGDNASGSDGDSVSSGPPEGSGGECPTSPDGTTRDASGEGRAAASDDATGLPQFSNTNGGELRGRRRTGDAVGDAPSTGGAAAGDLVSMSTDDGSDSSEDGCYLSEKAAAALRRVNDFLGKDEYFEKMRYSEDGDADGLQLDCIRLLVLFGAASFKDGALVRRGRLLCARGHAHLRDRDSGD